MELSLVSRWPVELSVVDGCAIFSSVIRRSVKVAMSQNDTDCDELMKKVGTERCQESFCQLFHLFFARLQASFKRSGIDEQKAHELAQETFVNVWKKAHHFDSTKGSFQVWLFRMARNLKFDFFRWQKSDVLNFSAEDIFAVTDAADFSESSDILAINQEVREKVSLLSAEQREVVEALYFEGYSQSEYAKLKQIPLGTVKSRIRLAMRQLKKGMVVK